jgi:hypothetical protein
MNSGLVIITHNNECYFTFARYFLEKINDGSFKFRLNLGLDGHKTGSLLPRMLCFPNKMKVKYSQCLCLMSQEEGFMLTYYLPLCNECIIYTDKSKITDKSIIFDDALRRGLHTIELPKSLTLYCSSNSTLECFRKVADMAYDIVMKAYNNNETETSFTYIDVYRMQFCYEQINKLIEVINIRLEKHGIKINVFGYSNGSSVTIDKIDNK